MPARFLTSSRIPFPHGFSTREGGVSEGPWASLNLGSSVGDDPARVTENLGRLCAEVGVSPQALMTVSQVHGDSIVEARASRREDADVVPPPLAEADAIWTKAEGVAVGVKTADCVPILLADPEGGRVAAVHSGWRGTELEIAKRAVEALVKDGARAEGLVAAVGPSIGACCYEVSEELAQRFTERFGEEVVTRPHGKPHLDLPRAVRRTLREAGLRDENIDVLARCNACEPDVFFSHRRDQGRTGRHLSFILKPA